MSLFYLTLVFPAAMVIAAIGDLMTMRIPNWLNLTIAAGFPVFALLLGMPFELMLWHFIAGFCVFVGGILIFMTNKIGGGDAKLLAAAALWMGWDNLLAFLFFTAIFGGALSIIWYLYRPLRVELEMRGVTWLNKILPITPELPYGIAIASGAVFCFPQTWWMTSLATVAP